MHLSQLSIPSFVNPQSRLTGNLGEDLQGFAVDADGGVFAFGDEDGVVDFGFDFDGGGGGFEVFLLWLLVR